MKATSLILTVLFCSFRLLGQTASTPVVPSVAIQKEFPVIDPAKDAAPSNRHKEVIQFPTKLKIERTQNQLSVAVDGKETKAVEITVGFKMTVGVREELFVYLVGEPRPAEPRQLGYTGGTDVTHSTSILNSKQGGIPVAGKHYVVEVNLIVFETDIPPQHHWMPESGKYKVLLSRVLKEIVE